MNGRIVLAGGSGFLGQACAGHFSDRGCEVVVLARSPGVTTSPVRVRCWDGESLGDWRASLEGAAALINLAGRTVNCRYHARNRKEILDSRVNSTRVLGEAIAHCSEPPRVWLNSSTATIYKHSLVRPMDEASGEIGATPEAKDEFSVDVARAWEGAFDAAITSATRRVTLRTAMVLGSDPNSVLPNLLRLARFGLGGSMAGGTQYVSWIHQLDFCRAVEWLIDRDALAGPVNVAAPNPVPNHELMRLVRERCGARFGLPATRWMLEIGALALRTETELIIKSRRVVPTRLLESGFTFRFPNLAGALADLVPR